MSELDSVSKVLTDLYLNKAHVYIVEDDDSVRAGLERTVKSLGCKVHAFGDPLEFLKAAEKTQVSRPCVFLFDMRLPNMTGLQLHHKLQKSGSAIPVIFVSGESTVDQAVDSLQTGALQFLVKPVASAALMEAVLKGLDEDVRRETKRLRTAKVQACMLLLTPREKEVFDLVVKGFGNSEIASKLVFSVPTAKQHKAQVMLKFKVKTLSELLDLIAHSERVRH
jgi:FixJ family two-component response regulator